MSQGEMVPGFVGKQESLQESLQEDLIRVVAMMKLDVDSTLFSGVGRINQGPDNIIRSRSKGVEVKITSNMYAGHWSALVAANGLALPHLNEVAHDKPLAEKGLKVYAVNCGDTKAKVEKFLDNHKLQLNVLLDSNDAMQKDYLVIGIPATVIVVGHRAAEMREQGLKELLPAIPQVRC